MTVIPALERELIAAARRESRRRNDSPQRGSAEAEPTNLIARARRLLRPHKRIAILVVALVVTGCAAVAATSLTGSTERLALGRVNCYYGTRTMRQLAKHSDLLDSGATLVNGESPQAWCRSEFVAYGRHSLSVMGLTWVKDPRLVACRKSPTTIAVLFATGESGQCRQSGLSPLPAAYATAATHARSLGAALSALYFSRGCWAPRPFATAVRAILNKHGLGRWRIVMPNPVPVFSQPAGTSPHCAAFIFPNPYVGNPYQSLNGPNRSFSFELGMSRFDYVRWNRLLDRLTNETSRACYKPAAARAMLDRAFAGTGLTVRLAITRSIDPDFHWATNALLPAHSAKLSPQLSRADAGKNHHYELGCVIQPVIWIGDNDRFADVWLTVDHGRWIKFGADRPPNSYFSQAPH